MDFTDVAHNAAGVFTSIILVATYTMRTRIPLRDIGIWANLVIIPHSAPTRACATATLQAPLKAATAAPAAPVGAKA